jgi:hypothetical protein
MKREHGDWTRYRSLPNLVEIDFHRGRRDPFIPYGDAMAEVDRDTRAAVLSAHAEGRSWVLIRHGASTSRPGQMTARSVVRGVMRDTATTPFILRSQCIQHDTCFVTAIRPKR